MTNTLLIQLLLVWGVYCHTYHAGRCPSMPIDPAFDMTRFTGVWYAIKKSSTTAGCMVYQFRPLPKQGQYGVKQEFYDHVFHTTRTHSAKIKSKQKKRSSSTFLTIRFSTNMFGSARFVVFTTDYTSYGGMITCQNFGLFHRRSAVILSRRRTLDVDKIVEIEQLLQEQNISPSELTQLRQYGCAPTKLVGV